MKQKLITVLLAIVALLGGGYAVTDRLGSVGDSEAYLSTTTPQVADLADLCDKGDSFTQKSTGVLGSVVILKSNVSPVSFYDATTSNVALRTGASTTLLLAEFPASPTVGTYTFDVQFKNGLLIDYSILGSGSTSTITYRCQG